MKNIIYLLACMALLSGCESTIVPEDNVKIKIENASELDMDSVSVSYPKEEVFYGNINSGQNTGYKTISKAYLSQVYTLMSSG